MENMSKLGRPSEYKEEYVGKVYEYLNEKEDNVHVNEENETVIVIKVNLPTIEGFARFIGVNKTSLYEWEAKHPKFSNALEAIRTEQLERLINNGLKGDYNSTIAKLMLSSNHGMREKSEQDITSAGKPIPLMNNVFTNNKSQEDSSTD